MWRIGLPITAVFCALAPLGGKALADNEPSSSYTQFGSSLQRFHYREYDPSKTTLDREDGVLPGLAIEAAWRRGSNLGVVRVEGADGTTPYDGRTQMGAPLRTHTEQRLFDAQAEWRRILRADTEDSIHVSLGIGFREWQRDIQPTQTSSELLETYQWMYWSAGLSSVFWRGSRWRLNVAGRLMRPAYATLDVHVPTYDAATLQLTLADTFELRFPLEYRLPSRSAVLVEPFIRYWQIKASTQASLNRNGMPTGALISEPDSETFQVGISASIRFYD